MSIFSNDAEEIMAALYDTLIVIKDELGNIVYPDDSVTLQYISTLEKTAENDELIDPLNSFYFKKDIFHQIINGKNYIIEKYMDITKYKVIEHYLEIDETTGVFQKKRAYEQFNRYLTVAIENETRFATIMADIDHFKDVNDTYGHQAGDEVLSIFAKNLYNFTRQNRNEKSPTRERDIVGRIGGEEFLIVFKNAPEEVAIERTEEIRKRIENTPIDYMGKEISITSSFGLLYIPEDQVKELKSYLGRESQLRSRILRETDIALYQAKESGRNKVLCKRFIA